MTPEKDVGGLSFFPRVCTLVWRVRVRPVPGGGMHPVDRRGGGLGLRAEHPAMPRVRRVARRRHTKGLIAGISTWHSCAAYAVWEGVWDT
jgi:hypothetical protein